MARRDPREDRAYTCHVSSSQADLEAAIGLDFLGTHRDGDGFYWWVEHNGRVIGDGWKRRQKAAYRAANRCYRRRTAPEVTCPTRLAWHPLDFQ